MVYIFPLSLSSHITLTKKTLDFILDTSHCDIVPRRWILTRRNNGWDVERIISVMCARLWPAEPQLDQALNRVRVISCYWLVFGVARVGGCGEVQAAGLHWLLGMQVSVL